jgi:hypothetical protein
MRAYSVYQTLPGGNAPAINGVAASGTDTYYSASWRGEVDFGVTVITTGTLTGSFTLWATDNPKADLTDDDDWVDMSTHADFAETNPAGAATKWRFSTTLMRGARFRLKFVNASGTGNLFAYVTTCVV